MPVLTMPKMGDAMEEGTILQWLKNEGDTVEEGDIVAEIQTEKATIEIPALEAGVLTRILVQVGQTVPVGEPIAELNGSGAPTGQAAGQEQKAETGRQVQSGGQDAGQNAAGQGTLGAGAPPPQDREQRQSGGDREVVPGEKPAGEEERLGREAHAPRSVAADLNQTDEVTGQIHGTPEHFQAGSQSAPTAEGRVKASPLARKVAEAHGVDLRRVEGTGPGGRIIGADVEEVIRQGAGRAAPAAPSAAQEAPAARAAQAPPTPAAPAPGARRKMSPMRKIIARRLQESKREIPHFYLTLDVDMRAAAALRGQYNAGADEDRRVSINDLVIRACALALEKHPQLHSRMEGDEIVTPEAAHIGVAVSLDEGLIVPVLRDVQNKSLSAIGREVRSLAERARKNQLKPEEYSGGGFTVSNLGMFDITQFQAIVNPPEVAILAVGAVRDTPIVEGGQVIPGKQMYLTISVDHRVVDGSTAAQFLQEVKRLLQNPLSLFG